MNKPLLIAAVCAGLPAYAQDAVPAPAPAPLPVSAHCAMPDEPPPASAALPARAGTRPEPHRGSVAPNSRLPSQVVTPSMRAMAAAAAAQEGQVEKNPQAHCEKAPAPAASEAGKTGRGRGEPH